MSTTLSSAGSGHTDYIAYIGTYTAGVYGYRFNASSGTLEPLGLLGKVTNPSFLATDRDYRRLYAVSELEGDVNGSVASFLIDRKSGKLTPLNSQGSGGQAPCHLSVDSSGRLLVVANYTTGQVSSFPIEADGKLGGHSSLMAAHGSGPNKERQDGPHAHGAYISPDNKRVYTPDLGLDEIRIYQLDLAHAKLEPNEPAVAHLPPGRGPRHLAFDAQGKFAYVLNELVPIVEVLRVDPSNGDLKLLQSVPTLPPDFKTPNTGAEIRMAPGGKFLYTSNRGADQIQVFAIDPTAGTLHQVQAISTEGKEPRGFDLDPTGHFLVAGNQRSNSIVVFRVDSSTGKLTPADQKIELNTPVDVLFVPAG